MTKILCLHGWGTSPEFLQYQLRNFIKLFPEFEFECMAAPIEIPITDIRDPNVIRLSPSKKFYTWKLNLFDGVIDNKLDISEAMDCIIDYMNKNGPFDGLCGFSMGGAFAQLFLEQFEKGLYKDKLKVQGPKFAIFCAANFFKLSNDLLTTPSIHLVGEKDFLVDAAILISTKFLNPLVLRNVEAHKFPKLSQYEIDKIRRYLAPVLPQQKKRGPRPKL